MKPWGKSTPVGLFFKRFLSRTPLHPGAGVCGTKNAVESKKLGPTAIAVWSKNWNADYQVEKKRICVWRERMVWAEAELREAIVKAWSYPGKRATVGSNYSAQLQLPRRMELAAPWPSAVRALDSPSSRPEAMLVAAAASGPLWTSSSSPGNSGSPSGQWASPRSADCPIATPASRRLVPVHHTASRRADDRERPGGRVKTESFFLFPSVLNRIRGLDAFAFAPRGVAHQPFWRRSCRPTRFSGPTGVGGIGISRSPSSTRH